MYDTIIVGAGPAGLSAAVYAHRKGMSVLVVTKNIGGQALESAHVDNYLGFKMLKGADLVKKFEEHIKSFGIEIKTEELVLKGSLNIPENAKGIVVFAHGSGSSRFSKRNQFVAKELQKAGLATLLMDLLTEEEEAAIKPSIRESISGLFSSRSYTTFLVTAWLYSALSAIWYFFNLYLRALDWDYILMGIILSVVALVSTLSRIFSG